jgi:hypothetical protein
MGVDYYRTQRPSIYHPATIGDIPFEVIQKSIRLLGRADLSSASLSCRAWRLAAVESILAQKRFDNQRGWERFICGMQLKTLVSGLDQYAIKNLDLCIDRVVNEYAHVIARFVAPTLSSLCLRSRGSFKERYEVLDTFFCLCLHIKSLRLDFFDFGADPYPLTPSIKKGFSCLSSLELNFCLGDIQGFAEQAPIHTLSILVYDGHRYDTAVASGVISSIAMKCRVLKSIKLTRSFTWESINKFFECCLDLEEINLLCEVYHLSMLKTAELDAIASLPHLKSLNLGGCLIADDAVSPLARCKRLRHLRGDYLKISGELLREIGGNLVSLKCRLRIDEFWGFVELCPNLEDLDIMVEEGVGYRVDNEEKCLYLEGVLKKGLKRLSRLSVNGRSVRLGTDWILGCNYVGRKLWHQ